MMRNREFIFVTDKEEVKSLKDHAETAKMIRKRSQSLLCSASVQ